MGKAIGIDLGTTNSVMAFVRDKQVEILPTSMNKDHLPSVVCYRERKGKGEYIVGSAALSLANMFPETTVRSIKRLMGRFYRDKEVNETKNRVPYAIVPAPNPKKDKGVYIDFGKEKLTPVEISAKILRQIKVDAEKALGEDVTHAVITVPAYFKENQRAATREAGEKAGLIVQRIIDEPTAAAIAYGEKISGDEGKRLMVYDLGGGTFDVSLIKTMGDQYVADVIQGDNWLGGDDFDNEITQIILDWLKQEKHDINKLKKDPLFMADLKKESEEAKIALSGSQNNDIITICRTSEGESIHLDLTITREEFEKAIRNYIERSIAEVKKTLSESGTEAESIDEVLLVGGSTAIPAVHEAIAKIFGEKKVRRILNPMHSVAMGAARLAADTGIECPNCKHVNADLDAKSCEKCNKPLAGERVAFRESKIETSMPTAMDLGIQAVEGENMHAFAVIIKKGTPYPLSKPITRQFKTAESGQKVIRIPVFEGVGKNVTDTEVRAQGELVIDVVEEFDKQEGLPQNHQIDISFDYDRNRTLTVTVNVEGTGKEVRHQLEYKDVWIAGLDFNESEEIETRMDEEVDEVLDEQTAKEDTFSMLKREVSRLKMFMEKHRALLEKERIEEIQEHIKLGRKLMLEETFNTTRGEIIIAMILDDLNTSGTASVVETIENICNAPIKPETRAKLKKGGKALIAEYKQNDKYTEKYDEIMANLRDLISIAKDELDSAGVETTAGTGGLVEGVD